MSNTEKPGNHVPVAEQYPPGNDDREAVATAILNLLGPTRATFTARDVADRTPFCVTKCGQILLAMARASDASDRILIEQLTERQAGNRYREAAPGVGR